MIKKYVQVETLVDKESFPKGTKGVVVSMYNGNIACEVELWDNDNYPVDVVTYLCVELKELTVS